MVFTQERVRGVGLLNRLGSGPVRPNEIRPTALGSLNTYQTLLDEYTTHFVSRRQTDLILIVRVDDFSRRGH